MRTLFVLFVLAWMSGPMAGANDPSSDAAVRARVKTLEKAWNARDAAGLAAGYALDGDVIIVDGARSTGREAIRRSAEASWPGINRERHISITVDSIRYLGPDVAIAECTALFSVGEPTKDRGTWVLVRREGAWSVAALRVLPAERGSP